MIIIDNDIALQFLEKYKIENGLKGNGLAKVFDVSPQMISSLFKRKRKVPKKIVRQLLEYYPDMDMGETDTNYIYHFGLHARSLEFYDSKYRIPVINQQAYSFIAIRDIHGKCKVGDLIICEMYESEDLKQSDLVVQFKRRAEVYTGKEVSKGFRAIAVLRY